MERPLAVRIVVMYAIPGELAGVKEHEVNMSKDVMLCLSKD